MIAALRPTSFLLATMLALPTLVMSQQDQPLSQDSNSPSPTHFHQVVEEGPEIDHKDTLVRLLESLGSVYDRGYIGYDHGDGVITREPAREYWQEINSRCIGLPDNQWELVYDILVDAHLRILKSYKQFDATLEANPSLYSIKNYSQATLPPDVYAIWNQPSEITDETLAGLKQALGPEEFKRLDDYAYMAYGGGTHIQIIRAISDSK
jgi:hypothetical protein